MTQTDVSSNRKEVKNDGKQDVHVMWRFREGILFALRRCWSRDLHAVQWNPRLLRAGLSLYYRLSTLYGVQWYQTAKLQFVQRFGPKWLVGDELEVWLRYPPHLSGTLRITSSLNNIVS